MSRTHRIIVLGSLVAGALLILGTTAAADTVRDEFSLQSYANNDGTADWRSDWFEAGDYGGATAGSILVTKKKQDLYISRNNKSVARSAFLDGATSATLRFDYKRINLNASQLVVLQVLPAGSGLWQELDRFEGPANDVDFLSVSYGFNAFVSPDTAIRFLTSSTMNGSSKFRVDNLEIEYTPGSTTVADWPAATDLFEAQAYDNDDGTVSWAGDWVEGGDDGDPATGNVVVQTNNTAALRISASDNSAARAVDLSAADFATLTFDYRRRSLDSANDYVAVEISSDGGVSWTELDRLAGPDNDTFYQLGRYNITGFLAADTVIRFRSAPTSMNDLDSVFFDNVRVLYRVAP